LQISLLSALYAGENMPTVSTTFKILPGETNIGIVGPDQAKFTKPTEARARLIIRYLLRDPKVSVVSGHCPDGGIDIFAEEIAEELGRRQFIYPPSNQRWEPYGYKARNIRIAKKSDVVFAIVLRELPAHYVGQRFRICYHCKTDTHVQSGGCWTAKYAERIGKRAVWIEI